MEDLEKDFIAYRVKSAEFVLDKLSSLSQPLPDSLQDLKNTMQHIIETGQWPENYAKI